MWCDVMWCDVILYNVIWCDVMWCDVMWCDVMSCDVMSCHVLGWFTFASSHSLCALIAFCCVCVVGVVFFLCLCGLFFCLFRLVWFNVFDWLVSLVFLPLIFIYMCVCVCVCVCAWTFLLFPPSNSCLPGTGVITTWRLAGSWRTTSPFPLRSPTAATPWSP